MSVLTVVGIVLLSVVVTAIVCLLWAERYLHPLKCEGEVVQVLPPGFIRTLNGELVSIDEAMPRP
jgi:hypothetical protein